LGSGTGAHRVRSRDLLERHRACEAHPLLDDDVRCDAQPANSRTPRDIVDDEHGA
jgi:hypothetical protein